MPMLHLKDMLRRERKGRDGGGGGVFMKEVRCYVGSLAAAVKVVVVIVGVGGGGEECL